MDRHSYALELSRPFARGVKHTQNLDAVSAHSIGDQIRCVRNHQLSGPDHPSRATECGVLLQSRHSLDYRHDDPASSGGIVTSDVVGFGVQVRQCRPQPSNLHRGSTSSPFVPHPCRWRSLPGRLPPHLS